MKIAYILPSLINKGPIIVVNNVIKGLINKVDVIDVYYFDDAHSKLDFPCSIYKINKNEKIEFNKYDLIHTHTLRADMYVYKWKKHIKNTKIISTIHQDTFKSFTYKFNGLVAFILTHYWCYVHRKFDGIISISNYIKDKYNKLLLYKIETIYNGCDVKTKFIDESIEKKIQNFSLKGFNVLGSYAVITRGKGLSQVISSLPFLPDFGFIIIGDGPYLNALKKLVSKLSLEERVLFIPYAKAPYSYLSYIDVYMMPSYSEGFGLAMVEAALQKKSIVCSNIDSFHEIFEEEEVSFFELDNLNSLIDSINKANKFKIDYGTKAYLKAKSKFTAKVMAENHLHYYKKILNYGN